VKIGTVNEAPFTTMQQLQSKAQMTTSTDDHIQIHQIKLVHTVATLQHAFQTLDVEKDIAGKHSSEAAQHDDSRLKALLQVYFFEPILKADIDSLVIWKYIDVSKLRSGIKGFIPAIQKYYHEN
jgi:hypothetical protein